LTAQLRALIWRERQVPGVEIDVLSPSQPLRAARQAPAKYHKALLVCELASKMVDQPASVRFRVVRVVNHERTPFFGQRGHQALDCVTGVTTALERRRRLGVTGASRSSSQPRHQ
jgi:hypothetical protein